MKKTALALAIGLVLIQVVPAAADLLVCIDDRPGRGCCDTSSTSNRPTEAAARLVDGGDCHCCVKVQVVSNAADATVQKVDADRSVESGVVSGLAAPVTRRVGFVSGKDPDNARLPSLRTVVLLI